MLVPALPRLRVVGVAKASVHEQRAAKPIARMRWAAWHRCALTRESTASYRVNLSRHRVHDVTIAVPIRARLHRSTETFRIRHVEAERRAAALAWRELVTRHGRSAGLRPTECTLNVRRCTTSSHSRRRARAQETLKRLPPSARRVVATSCGFLLGLAREAGPRELGRHRARRIRRRE
jgi:hypothetical protein